MYTGNSKGNTKLTSGTTIVKPTKERKWNYKTALQLKTEEERRINEQLSQKENKQQNRFKPNQVNNYITQVI